MFFTSSIGDDTKDMPEFIMSLPPLNEGMLL